MKLVKEVELAVLCDANVKGVLVMSAWAKMYEAFVAHYNLRHPRTQTEDVVDQIADGDSLRLVLRTYSYKKEDNIEEEGTVGVFRSVG